MSTAIPRSLQALIDCARASNASGAVDEIDWDPELEASLKEHTEQLSRGEYSAVLYWECVADDCEEDSDWRGAKAALLKVIAEEGADHLDRWKAHDRLGRLHSLLGEGADAADHYRAAARESELADSDVLTRITFANESRSLVRLGRLREARHLVRKGFTVDCLVDDQLSDAHLEMCLALCYHAERRPRRAFRHLRHARQLLDAIKESLEESDAYADASGVHAIERLWWSLDAECCRVLGEPEREIEARRRVLDLSRWIASETQWPGPKSDAGVARALLALADALRHAERAHEAESLSIEAGQIAECCRLPDSALTFRLTPEFPPPRRAWYRP